MNMFRYTFVQKKIVSSSPILILKMLNHIAHKPLPFKRENMVMVFVVQLKLCSGLGL